ncbi:hypothetical protein ACFQZS_10075 [Mucilaginibacter calamicampi]|uniref:Glycerophosphoryl diester phosphodiesterase membrane domain-containing protein n=1 Tax=Mucilaginibacter calamicampi TaxID=1302352 RepID=A0ABW2YY02_9SPHI
MKQPNIELAKVRDFSAIINDSFLFLRQNFKPLLRSYFTFCGFFIVATIVASAMQQIKMLDLTGSIQGGQYEGPISRVSQFTQVGVTALITLFFTLLTYTAIVVTVLSYMTIYKEKGNTPATNEEVWGYLKYYYFKIFGSTILNTILLIIGMVFCLIPGVWLYPILGLMFPIMIMENSSYGYAFNQSFRLIKDNWWTTFGALFIMGVIVGITAAIFSLPGALWTEFAKLLHWPGGNIAAILTAVLTHLAMVLYILPIITLALCYFSLNEEKEGTGLMARINQIGDNKDQNNLPAEDY